MDTAKLSFDIETSNAECPMGVEIWLDDAMLLSNNHVQGKITFIHDISDDVDERKLRIVIFGKPSDYTQVDDAGNIIKDATLQISNVAIDDLDVNQLFLEKCVYTHDFNGTGATTQAKFYGEMGCNGTVSLKFATPMYLWLLEHM